MVPPAAARSIEKPGGPSPAKGSSAGDPAFRIITPLRLTATLTGLVSVLIAALCGLIVVLVGHIFNRITPTIQEDLEWKAVRGAVELVQSAEIGIILRDQGMILESLGDYRANTDILAVAVVGPAGEELAMWGSSPVPAAELFQGRRGGLRREAGRFVSWRDATVEGKVVGRLAVVVSDARLDEGEKLRKNILWTAALGGIAGLLLSVSFVALYVGPLLNRSKEGYAVQQRLSKELEIGARIQTSILPNDLGVLGLEIAARMDAASEVGGDYYDVLPTPDGAWIGIGDVTGHGLTSGLVMLMVQSAIAALRHAVPETRPSAVLDAVNRALFENIRCRMKRNEHVTLSLLQYRADGTVVYAGAHEEMIVYRAAERRCELVETPGTWLGAMRDVRRATVDSTLVLGQGDMLVLYTDGVTEAMDASLSQFGLERLCAVVEAAAGEPVEGVRDRIFGEIERWRARVDDDATVVILRKAST